MKQKNKKNLYKYALGSTVEDPIDKIISKQDNTKNISIKIKKPSRGSGWNDFVETSNPGKIIAMDKMLKKYGNPNIESNNKRERASYGIFNNTIYADINPFDSGAEEIIAELAHSKQIQNSGTLPYYIRSLYENYLNTQKGNYNKRGTIENEAHKIIEPQLAAEYRDLLYKTKSTSVMDKLKDKEIMSTKKNKYKLGSYVTPKYAFGDFVKSDTSAFGAPIGAGANILGQAIGGTEGSVLSSAGSMAAAGAALGPLGIAGGAILGGITGLIGANKQKKAEARARTKAWNQADEAYGDAFESNIDTINSNPYGNLSYADGGPVKGKKSVSTSVPNNLDWVHQDYTTTKGTKVTDKQYRAYKDQGLDFGNTKNLGLWIDSWAGQPTPAPKQFDPTGGNTRGYESTGLHNRQIGNKFAKGGDITDNTINIEKGELQIDPESGKILREYNGINPETGGLYKPHSKGKDPVDNMVLAEPGTFIVTKAKSKQYKDALDNNDKITQSTILQNIRNYKNKSEKKYATGSDVKPGYLFAPGAHTEGPAYFNPRIAGTVNPAQMNTKLAGIQTGTAPTSSNFGQGLSKAGDFLTNYGPSLLNIGQGLFGKVDQQSNVNPIVNPYKSKILSNMPQDIDFSPVRQEAIRQQNTAFNRIDNTTSSSPIARANKSNIFANTQSVLGRLAMENQINNNQVRSQRAGIYSNLGNQEMNELARVQGINLGIDENNRANRAAKQNLLNQGISQLQQTYQNQKTNQRKSDLDNYQVDLLKQIFPSINPYFDTTFNPNKKRV